MIKSLQRPRSCTLCVQWMEWLSGQEAILIQKQLDAQFLLLFSTLVCHTYDLCVLMCMHVLTCAVVVRVWCCSCMS